MAELTEAERQDLAEAAAAAKRIVAQSIVTAGIKGRVKLRLEDVDAACDGDPVADRLDFKGKLILAGLL